MVGRQACLPSTFGPLILHRKVAPLDSHVICQGHVGEMKLHLFQELGAFVSFGIDRKTVEVGQHDSQVLSRFESLQGVAMQLLLV